MAVGGDVAEFVDALRRGAAGRSPGSRRADLWRAEAAWWRRVEGDARGDGAGSRCSRATSSGRLPCWPSTPSGGTALAVAARRGRLGAEEAFDAAAEHALVPARMSRVAVVAPETRLREVLVAVADAGVRRAGRRTAAAGGEALEALRRLEAGRRAGPSGSRDSRPARRRGAGAGRRARPARRRGRARAARRGAVRHGSFAALVGWAPERASSSRCASASRATAPRWSSCARPAVDRAADAARAPAAGAGLSARSSTTYGTARYRDVDPTLVRGSVVRPDVRDDVRRRRPRLVLVAARALLLRRRRRPLRPLPAAVAVRVRRGPRGGVLRPPLRRGFGPTGLVPTLWLSPARPADPAARRRRRGRGRPARRQLRDRHRQPVARGRAAPRRSSRRRASPGSLVFARLGLRRRSAGTSAARRSRSPARARRRRRSCCSRSGFAARGGPRRGRRHARRRSSSLDAVVRVGANVISFTRLAAFGLMHAALGAVVFDGARALWGGAVGSAAAVALFVVGNVDRLRARGARRRRPGAAARVLRALLAHLRRRGAAVRALAASRRIPKEEP